MEMISRDEAIAMLEDMEGRRDEDGYIRVYKLDVIANLRSLPSIDLVRCRECEYYIDNTCDCYSLYGDLSGDLIGVHFEPNEDHFCSYGERRADGDI